MPQGIVEAKRKDSKGFKLDDGNWYSVFNASDCPERGDTIKFDFVAKGRFNNVRGTIEKLGSGAPPATPGGSSSYTPRSNPNDEKRQRSIIRQNSLGHATTVVINDADGTVPVDDLADEIIRVARKFEAYSSGEGDIDELAKALEGGFADELVDTSK